MEQSILELHPGLVWGFGITVVIMLMLDLGIFNKKSHVVTNKEATVWTIVWISFQSRYRRTRLGNREIYTISKRILDRKSLVGG